MKKSRSMTLSLDYILGDEVSILLYRSGKRIETHFIFAMTEPYPIRKMYPHYENIEYDVIGGMVIMQLVDNHFPLLGPHAPELIYYTDPENKTKPVLVITHLLPGSYTQQLRTLGAGFIITQINGVPVSTLTSLRQALHKSVATDLITIKTADHVFVALPLRKLLLDENRLAEDFGYPISKTVLELNELCSG